MDNEEKAAQNDSKTNGDMAISMDLDESLTNRKNTNIVPDETSTPAACSTSVTSIGGNASNTSLISLNETACSIIDIPDSTPDVSCELVTVARPRPRDSDIYITDEYNVSDKTSSDSDNLSKRVAELPGNLQEPSQLPAVRQYGHMRLLLSVEYTVSHSPSHGTVNELIRLKCSPTTEQESVSGQSESPESWSHPAPPPAAGVGRPPHARFSHASSTSSGSSIASSASALALANRLAGAPYQSDKQQAPLPLPLSHERISELRDKWLNSREVWRLLDYVDRHLVDPSKLPQHTPPPPPTCLSQIDEVTTPSASVSDGEATRRAPKVKFDSQPEREQTTPRKKQRKIAATTANGHEPAVENVAATTAGTPAADTSFYTSGDCVFAKWTDRKFYAATLVERRVADGRWTVDFYDGDKRAVNEENMLLAGEPAMIGQRVFAADCDDEFTVGIVTGCEPAPDGSGRLRFSVAREDRDICVPAEQILLTESQVRQVRSRCAVTGVGGGRATPIGGSSLTSGSGRATRSKTRALARDSPVPGSSGTQPHQQRPRAAGRQAAASAQAASHAAASTTTTTSDSEDESTTAGSTCNGLDPYAYVPDLEAEAAAAYDACGRLKGKTVAGKMRFGTGVADEALGPLPPAGCMPFKNLHVVLSCVVALDMTTVCTGASDAGSTTTSCSASENYRFSTAPYVKARLREQLEAGGATVHARFEDLPAKQYKHAYIVSNRPSRSARYVMCLAAGVRTVCHDWVIRCCKEGRTLPPQDLPCGWSLELERYVNWHDRPFSSACILTAKPLRRRLVLVASATHPAFTTYWTRVLELAEANVRSLATTTDAEVGRALCVLCDYSYRDERTERARHRGVPLVTTTWLLQTLVHGELRDFQKLPCYRPDYYD